MGSMTLTKKSFSAKIRRLDTSHKNKVNEYLDRRKVILNEYTDSVLKIKLGKRYVVKNRFNQKIAIGTIKHIALVDHPHLHVQVIMDCTPPKKKKPDMAESFTVFSDQPENEKLIKPFVRLSPWNTKKT
jgi:hypothetical protein